MNGVIFPKIYAARGGRLPLGLKQTMVDRHDACYDRGALLFFSEVPQFGSLRPLPKP